MYFVAFAGIIIGLITYNVRPPPAATPKKKKIRGTEINDNRPKEWTESNFKPQNGTTMFFLKNKDGSFNNLTFDSTVNSNSRLINHRIGPNGNYTSI